MKALRVFWQAIRDLYDDLMLLAGVSILWWLAILLVVPGPAATAGLYYLAYRIAHEQRVEFAFFWEELKASFWKAWPLAAINLTILIMLLVNIVFYGQMTNVLQYATFVWLYLLVVWLSMQLHLFPMWFKLEEPRVLLVLRNAVLLPLARPGFTLLLLLLLLVTSILSLVLPILLLAVWPALLALVGTRATMTTIEEIAERQAKHQETQS